MREIVSNICLVLLILYVIVMLIGLCSDPLAVVWSGMDAYVDSLEDEKKEESDGIEYDSSDSE